MSKYDVIKGMTLIMIACLFYACQNGKVNAPDLLLAEELMEEHPDSALTLLQQIPDSLYTKGPEQALYCLLLTEAMDKTFAIHTTDSLIAIAAHYYDSTKDLVHKAKAWYYWGRVSQDLLHRDKALECYLKAKAYAKERHDNRLLALIYNYLGNLYRQLEIYDEAMKNTKLAYKYCFNLNDTLNIPYAMRDIGRVYLFQKKVDSAFVYFDHALKLADLYKNIDAKGSVLNDIGTAYRQKKDYNQAIHFIKASIPLKDEDEQYSSYLSLVRLYFHQNKIDSLEYYLELAERNPDIYIQEGTTYYRYELSIAKGEYRNAIFYNEKYQALKDSISEKAQRDEIMRLKYDYKQKEMKKEMERDAAQERFVYICWILLLVIIIGSGSYFHVRSRWAQEQTLRLQERKIQHEKELRLQSLEKVRENLVQISVNKQKLIDKELDLKAAQKELLVYDTKLLKAENDLITLKNQEKALRDKLFSQTKLTEQIRCVGTDTHKKDIDLQPFCMKKFPFLVEKLDEFYDDFYKRLKTKYPILKERDMEVCCLIKAGARTGNIASLIPMTPNAVTKKKKQILDKMELKGISLDDFLATF